MNTFTQLDKRITVIEKRNEKVELDKAWETSGTRKIILIANTYIVIGLFMWFMNINNPWINAIVPSIGYFLSTLTLPFIKRWWIARRNP